MKVQSSSQAQSSKFSETEVSQDLAKLNRWLREGGENRSDSPQIVRELIERYESSLSNGQRRQLDKILRRLEAKHGVESSKSTTEVYVFEIGGSNGSGTIPLEEEIRRFLQQARKGKANPDDSKEINRRVQEGAAQLSKPILTSFREAHRRVIRENQARQSNKVDFYGYA